MNKKLWFTLFILVVCIADSNAGDHIIKGKITSQDGMPIKNAVVYVEVHREGKGAFDFGYAIVDSTSQGDFSIKIRWGKNALIAYAVFAEDMNTIAGFDWVRYYYTHDLDLKMSSIPSDSTNCEIRLLGMSFPFERNKSLFKRLQRQDNKKLISTIVRAYKSFINGTCPVSRGNEGKIRAIKEIKDIIESW